jgi:predicted kinase
MWNVVTRHEAGGEVRRGQVPPRLILLCGLPGSGKTTVAKRLADEVPAVRLCPDDWLAAMRFDLHAEHPREQLEIVFWEHAQQLLRLGVSVILESGFWTLSATLRRQR